jgi:hypothetical protein
MKKLAFAIIILAIVWTSCKSSSEASPMDLMTKLIELGKKGDLEGSINEMCIADATTTKAFMEKYIKDNGLDRKEYLKQQSADFKKTFEKDIKEYKNEKINGNEATIDVVNKETGEINILKFVKENGSWKICVNVAQKMARNTP